MKGVFFFEQKGQYVSTKFMCYSKLKALSYFKFTRT
jgi:hypothetical protein